MTSSSWPLRRWSRVLDYLTYVSKLTGVSGVAERVKGRRVAVVGLGVLGSHVALLLSRLPLRLVLVDDDVVWFENIGYQAYHVGSVGKPKVEALVEVIARHGGMGEVAEAYRWTIPSICELAKGRRLNEYERLLEVIAASDVVVDTLDDERYRLVVELAAAEERRPLVVSSFARASGTVYSTPDSWGQGYWCTWTRISNVERANYFADPILAVVTAGLTAWEAFALLAGLREKPVRYHVSLDISSARPGLAVEELRGCRHPPARGENGRPDFAAILEGMYVGDPGCSVGS